MMRLCLLHTTALAASLLLSCCNNQAGIELDPRTTPPLDTTLTENEIRIYAGIAVAVDAIPLSGGEPSDDGTTVVLTSTNVNVIGVDPAPAEGVFVIYGVMPGTADVRVYVNGDVAGDIPATVLDQGGRP